MKFTIVITTYNRLALLRRAIHTALKQTVECEVIVVDDCSSDGTQEYVNALSKEYWERGDRRLVYHRNATNLGHSQSVNAGIERATGEWIKLVDDDDYLAPNCIEVMAEAIALRPQAVLCSCQAVQVDEAEAELSKTQPIGPGKAFYIPQADLHYGMLLEQIPFGTPVQVAFKRGAFLQSGGWDSSLDANFDDIDSWVKIAQFGDAIFLNQYLAYRTVWSGSFNQKFSLQDRLKTNIAIKHRIYDLIHEKYQSEIPSREAIEDYLKLHWSLVALKGANFLNAIDMGRTAIFSPSAWNLLLDRANRSIKVKPSSWERLRKVSENREILDICEEIQIKQVAGLRRYLRLRWGYKALEKKEMWSGVKAFSSALFSLQAWKILMVATFPQLNQSYYLSKKKVEQNNLAAASRIYALIDDKDSEFSPEINEIQAYLKLQLFKQSVKEKKFIRASQFLLPTLLSPVAWKLLRNLARWKYRKSQAKKQIHKLVIMEF